MPRGGWSLSALPPKADTLTGGHQCPLSATSRHSGLCREVENRKAAAYLRLAQAEFTQNFLIHPKATPHDLTVFSVRTVARALTFTDELCSGMSKFRMGPS